MNTPRKLLDNRIPADYAAAAVVAREVSREMLARLEWVTLKPTRIVEVGCVVGECTEAISQRYPTAEIHAFDTQENLLEVARAKQLPHVTWQKSEAHILPLKDHSVDLLLAHFVLPWCEDMLPVLNEWRRVLRQDGLLLFTSLGPDTLRELQTYSLTLPHLLDMHHMGDAVLQAGFQDPVLDVDYFTVTFRDQEQLFRELKVTGMMEGDWHTISLVPNEENIFPMTFEVVFGHAWGTGHAMEHVADESGTVKIPVSHILRR